MKQPCQTPGIEEGEAAFPTLLVASHSSAPCQVWGWHAPGARGRDMSSSGKERHHHHWSLPPLQRQINVMLCKSLSRKAIAWNWLCVRSPSVIKSAFVIVFGPPRRKIALLLIIAALAGPLRGLWRWRRRLPLDWGAKLKVSVGLKIQAFA